jgi:hypothetical protein
MKIRIWYISDTILLYFNEVIINLKENLKNYDVTCDKVPDPEALNLAFGAAPNAELVEKYSLNYNNLIIINYEQLSFNGYVCLNDKYFNLLKRYRVWDYNTINQKWLKENLNVNADILRLGYCKELEIIPQSKQDIDVLFIGHLNERRKLLYNALCQDKNVLFLDSCWGEEKLSLISRSKIVLNLHYYSTAIFEWVRVSQLLNNKVFVISEVSNDDVDYHELDGGLIRVAYDEIHKTINYYLQNEKERLEISEAGYQKLKNMNVIIPEIKDSKQELDVLTLHDRSIFLDENSNIIDHKNIEREEQLDVFLFLPKYSKVLELGARYGTVSCLINRIINNKKNQLVVEPDSSVIKALEINRDNSQCEFNIFNGAISKTPLTFHNTGYGSVTTPSNVSNIKIATLDEFNLKFDAVVADCEAFFGKFMDENDMSNFKIIILEKDQPERCNYDEVERQLLLYGFLCIRNTLNIVYRSVYINMNFLPFNVISYSISYGSLGFFNKLGYEGNHITDVIIDEDVITLSAHSPSTVVIVAKKKLTLRGYISPTSLNPLY